MQRLAVVALVLFAVSVAVAIRPVRNDRVVFEQVPQTYPLVSVIIPTHDRPEFLAQSIALIERQDYPNLEVIIVDDSEVPQPEISSSRLLIKYIHIAKRLSIGEKRNIAVQNAKGAIIVHWDDDDYFREHRISEQVMPILAKEADMTVLEHHFYYIKPKDAFFTVKRPRSWGPHFGTFVYSRAIFEQANIRYPDNSLAEDYSFAELALEAGYKIKVLSNTDGKHVYVRHENTWQFDFEEYDAQVTEVDVPDFLSKEDHLFLQNIKMVVPHALPPNHFVSPLTKWDRKELHPADEEDDDKVGEKKPKYPHYKPKKEDNGLSTGAKIGIGVGVAGGVVAIVVMGIGAYFFFQWQKRRYPGYTRINTDV